jgi:xylulokinase
MWWTAVCRATSRLIDELNGAGYKTDQLAAVAVDGTSGTVVPLDAVGEPLRSAIMYNDARASAEAEELNTLAGEFCGRLGYRFAASFALAKILWLRSHEPIVFERTVRFVHQADYILGRLSGEYGVSDYSNALKTGYDLVDDCWPGWLTRLSSVAERLPRVVTPGTPLGYVSAAAAEKTGLPARLPVVAGASDGTAASLASGLKRPGDYNLTLGTTLVFKGVSSRICRHAEGLIYCQKLPGGLWLPGAASNTGNTLRKRGYL